MIARLVVAWLVLSPVAAVLIGQALRHGSYGGSQ